jgi:REP element-mobilizing transposase RayT
MRHTILVISTDYEFIYEITVHLERGNRFHVIVTRSDEEALDLTFSRKPKLIIIDTQGRGVELAGLISRLTPAQPDIQFLFYQPQGGSFPLTADLTNVVVKLNKPFSSPELDDALFKIFGEVVRQKAILLANAEEESFIEEDGPEESETHFGEAELKNLNALIGSLPSPDPERTASAFNAVVSELKGDQQDQAVALSEGLLVESALIEQPSLRQVTQGQFPPLPGIIELNKTVEKVEVPVFIDVDNPNPNFMSSEPGTTPMGVKTIKFEYYCVLIPANPNQFLARDISDRLGFILPQIHMSRGWRVNSLSVRPLFMMWRIVLPAGICPAHAIKEIKLRTTSHLYTNFPELLKNNDEHDFWAPGYVILSGQKAPSNTLIREYIQRTRTSLMTQST